MYCLKCKRDLRKVTDDECPNCHQRFDPMDSRTFRRVLWLGMVRHVCVVVMTFFVGWLIAFAFVSLDPYTYVMDKAGTKTVVGVMSMSQRVLTACFIGIPIGVVLLPATFFFVGVYIRLRRNRVRQ